MDLVYACPAAVPWLDQRGLTEGRAHVAPVCPERRQEAGVRKRVGLEVQAELEYAEFGPRPDLVVQVVVAGPEFADPRQVQRAVRTEPSGRVRSCRDHHDADEIGRGETFGRTSGNHCPKGC